MNAALFHRVLQVLGEKQNTSAHWRPSKPFLAKETGEIILPLSVEVANSLMRCIATMDEARTHDTYTSQSLPLLRRFWGWLEARAVRRTINDVECVAWHSEHINRPEVIHPWDTSQVIDFMIAYRHLVEREIQTTTLRLSGLLWADPPKVNRSTADQRWGEVVQMMDPSPNKPSNDQVYHQIGENYVQGWSAGSPTKYSMLLYGPPGTGKTSVAEKLSETLGMRLITVTVSDFLGSGGANVESRAKAIFQTLEHQRNAVILFDEIDSFLLDRDSKLYREQDSLFQFLTPGMLTKVNNLRKRERSIFIIATNYANRIDPAIKRTGRVDQSFLLSLPDSRRREAIMVGFGFPTGKFSAELKKVSVFFGFTDLKNVALKAKAAPDPTSTAIELLRNAPKATSLQSYVDRMKSDASDFPQTEFEDLVRLAKEADATDLISDAVNSVKDETQREKLKSILKLEEPKDRKRQ